MKILQISASQLFGGNYYMLFFVAAVITGVAFAGIAALKSKFGLREYAIIVSSGILSLIIGSKVVMFDGSQWNYLFNHFHLPIENGKSTIGAVLGLMIGLWAAGKLFCKNESVLNLFAVSLPLGKAVQSFGCLSAGCCHGALTNVPWGITYGPGSRLYAEQQQLGLIPSDAVNSLAVHPSPFYTILVCILFSFIVWTTRSLWKSPSGNFMFSIILYLAYLVIEEISSYSLPTREWMGMTTIAWKSLILLSFISILIYRELKFETTGKSTNVPRSSEALHDLKLFSLAFAILIVSIQLADWLTPDERTLTLLIIFPLCGVVILEKLFWSLLSLQLAKTSWILFLAFVLMSQKADTPPGTPSSYTSFNLTSTFGKYDMEHLFNKRLQHDCDGDPYLTGDHVRYHHTYVAGGIGISRKKYYTPWRSTLLSLNVFAGQEKITPFLYPNKNLTPPNFKSTLWSINPLVQFDTRGIGLGLGASFGNVAYDKEYNLNNLEDYTPKGDGRNFVLQTRLRFFSERYFFIEMLGGYDGGSTGEYNYQALAGSRFNTDKYLLKVGFAKTEYSVPAFVFKGEMLLASNLFLSPQFIKYKDDGAYRAVIGLEYRFHDKVRNKLNN